MEGLLGSIECQGTDRLYEAACAWTREEDLPRPGQSPGSSLEGGEEVAQGK